MSHPELLGDWHVHSTFSDDAVSPIDENLAAASAAGLTAIRLTDHVRASTPWVPEFVAAVARIGAPSGLAVSTGVEAKIMDADGTLDVPHDLRIGPGGVDGIVIADHQFPGPDGPWSPERTRLALSTDLAPADAVDLLVTATIRAMHRAGGSAQLAHPFSILPKIGLDETAITDEHLHAWASAAAATGTRIEVNEKWSCPGARAIAAARRAGAMVVASTDSHDARDIGRYDRVVGLLDAASSWGEPT